MAYLGGVGSMSDPYLVGDVATFMAIPSDNSSSKVYYKQVSDLDFTGITTRRNVRLYGGYDGGGFKIKNYTYSGAIDSNMGLFFSEIYGVVKNLEIDSSCSITATSISGSYACVSFFGTLYSGAVLENCINRGRVSTSLSNSVHTAPFGNVYGSNSGIKLNGCLNYGVISGGYTSSGLVFIGQVGYSGAGVSSVTFNGCANYGAIDGNMASAGIGVVQSYTSSTGYRTVFKDCYNEGTITSTSGDAGGVCTYRDYYTQITVQNCINKGIIKGFTSAGGICGAYTNGSLHPDIIVKNCFSLGDSIRRIAGSSRGSAVFNRIISQGNYDASNVANNYALNTMELRFE